MLFYFYIDRLGSFTLQKLTICFGILALDINADT